MCMISLGLACNPYAGFLPSFLRPDNVPFLQTALLSFRVHSEVEGPLSLPAIILLPSFLRSDMLSVRVCVYTYGALLLLSSGHCCCLWNERLIETNGRCSSHLCPRLGYACPEGMRALCSALSFLPPSLALFPLPPCTDPQWHRPKPLKRCKKKICSRPRRERHDNCCKELLPPF